MLLYPLKFKPLFKYRIWGGSKLKIELNKQYEEESIGESWEVSDVENEETLVLEGDLKGKTLKQLISTFKEDFLGDKVYKEFGVNFPLLIKFIDAKTPLSIQVHPSNELAKERHNSFGKNEMWVVMDADDSAELIVGFDKEIDRKAYQKHINNNTILNVMHHEKVKKGDTFYIPTGRIHAIGAGVLLAEIQQTSNITYRIHDYNRVDVKTGTKRELHTELALDAIDFTYQKEFKTHYEKTPNVSNKLVHSPYFKTNFLNITKPIAKDYSNLDSFVIYMCISGRVEVVCDKKSYALRVGETILLPAIINNVMLQTNNAEVLEVSL